MLLSLAIFRQIDFSSNSQAGRLSISSLISRAFPNVPWIFLYRDPIEVMSSLLRGGRGKLPPGLLEGGLLNIDAANEDISDLEFRPEEFWARVLARSCSAAIDYHKHCPGLIINYRELPAAIWESVLEHFGVYVSNKQIDIMRSVAGFNAKLPNIPFTTDAQTKRESASDATIDAASRWVMPMYDQLELSGKRRTVADID